MPRLHGFRGPGERGPFAQLALTRCADDVQVVTREVAPGITEIVTTWFAGGDVIGVSTRTRAWPWPMRLAIRAWRWARRRRLPRAIVHRLG